jgi:hypothetical protein
VAVLNLLWFAAALRTTLADAGQGGWGAAATAASAAVGGLFLLLIAVSAALGYSIIGSGNLALASGLNDLSWAGFVLTSFPRAMLIMAGTFGLWRARLISNKLFAADLAERWILGTRRRLFAVRLAHHRSRVGGGREPRSVDVESRHARGMVMAMRRSTERSSEIASKPNFRTIDGVSVRFVQAIGVEGR